MLDISEGEYKHFNHYLNEQLEEAINRAIIDEKYDEIKGLIANDKLLPINKKIYDLLFCDTYPLSPKLLLMLKNDNLQDVVSFFIKYVPKDFLCAAEPQDNTPFITCIFHHRQNLVPNLLKIISESGRDDVIVRKNLVLSIENRIKNIKDRDGSHHENESCAAYSCSNKNQDYYNTKEAIEKYCTKNKDGNYEVSPYYLLPIQGESQELQQCFKNIVIAINSNNLDEVKNALGKVERTHKINVDSVNEALCMLVEKTKPSKEIALTIIKFLGDINFPTMLENTSAKSPAQLGESNIR